MRPLGEKITSRLFLPKKHIRFRFKQRRAPSDGDNGKNIISAIGEYLPPRYQLVATVVELKIVFNIGRNIQRITYLTFRTQGKFFAGKTFS